MATLKFSFESLHTILASLLFREALSTFMTAAQNLFRISFSLRSCLSAIYLSRISTW